MTNIKKLMLTTAIISIVSAGDAFAAPTTVTSGVNGATAIDDSGVEGTFIITATDGTTISDDLDVGGNLDVTGDTTSTDGNVTLTNGDLELTNGNATIGGTLDVDGTLTASGGIDADSNQINGVANGTLGTDAVNLNQLNAVGATSAAAINRLDGEIKDLKGGVASAIAIATIPGVPAGKQFAIGFGGGTYDGQNAGALKLSFAPTQMPQVQLSASAALSDGATGAGVGVSYGF